MSGAIGFIVGGGLLIEIMPILDRAGADAQKSEDQEDGGKATQGKKNMRP